MIQCITPISQRVAEQQLNMFSHRRRSVANIDAQFHSQFAIDADLLKIREEFLGKSPTAQRSGDVDHGVVGTHDTPLQQSTQEYEETFAFYR